MKVTNEIRTYELNGEATDSKAVEESNMKIISHWNFKDRVTIKYGDVSVVVLVSDLQKAIANASNH